MSESGGITEHRAERILAFMFIGVVALSIICFFAVMIGTFSGVSREEMGTGIWPLVVTLPLFGLPLAFLLLIAVLIVNGVRRARASRAGSS